MQCPECNTTIPKKNVNIATDVAQCAACHTVFRISDATPTTNMVNTVHPDFELKNMPHGVKIEQEVDKIIIRGTTRAWAQALIFAPFGIVFLGIGLLALSFFMYTQVTDIVPYLVITPFLGVGSMLCGVSLFFLFGKVELVLNKTHLSIFNGIGRLGHTVHVPLTDITVIEQRQVRKKKSGRKRNISSTKKITVIVLEGRTYQQFGRALLPERRKYIEQALQLLVQEIKADKIEFRTDFTQHLLDK